MDVKEEIKEEERDIWDILWRLRKKDFSGNKGQAIKNSSYQLAIIVMAKLGALFFTILIARILLPELFGLYSLAFSTIAIFAGLSDLGLGRALITFISKNEKSKPSKAKAYFNQLFKWKIYLIFLVSLVLILSAYFIANIYYNKPIFLALLVGALYLPAFSLVTFAERGFRAVNNFKYPLIKEGVFQLLRFTLIPLVIFYSLKYSATEEIIISSIFLVVTISYFIILAFLLVLINKKLSFLKGKEKPLTKKEKANLKWFILPLSATALSGIFFGYIDMIMLGHFVTSKFIGFYQPAFSLVTSAAAIIGFASAALFPIFSRLRGMRLENGFKKSVKLIFLISILAMIFTFLFAPLLINIIFGAEYAQSITLLRLFSVLLISAPLIGLYTTYYISQENTAIYAKLLITSTIINVILNYVLITRLLSYGMFQAVMGACIATITSRYIYLMGLVIYRKKS